MINVNEVTKEYNELMLLLGRGHNTIGTDMSDGTEGWTLADMVYEVEYTLDIYEDDDCIYKPRYQLTLEDILEHSTKFQDWFEYTELISFMKQFIKKYKKDSKKYDIVGDH